ncbi:hypothetical protein D3C85_1554240 [compost metagenome]
MDKAFGLVILNSGVPLTTEAPFSVKISATVPPSGELTITDVKGTTLAFNNTTSSKSPYCTLLTVIFSASALYTLFNDKLYP